MSNDASKEVIDAAYRALSKKHHPDVNKNDPASATRMSAINASYDVLSDFGKRFLYDKHLEAETIAERFARATAGAAKRGKNFGRETNTANAATASGVPRLKPKIKRALSAVAGIACVLIVAGVLRLDFSGGLSNTLRQQATAQIPAQPVPYTHPATAPNGKAWPSSAGYVDGYAIKNTAGASTIAIDNSRNDTDIFVKLFFADDPDEKSLRVFYIPQSSNFVLQNLDAARYVIQYMDLTSGHIFKTAAFALKEKQTPDGMKKPGGVRMTLRKVTYNITVDTF